MCGIAGSTNTKKAFELYQSNLNRGAYSTGVMTIGGYEQACINIYKFKGVIDRPEPEFPKFKVPVQYTLYHSRAPTVETNGYVGANNHPFEYGDWIIAHNGIISNFEKLWSTYGIGDPTGKTDSCIIPRMLDREFTIGETLEKLEGTFALWMYNKSRKELFITRSSNTLFADMKTGDFSSTEFEGSTALEEGLVYSITVGNNYLPTDNIIAPLYFYKINSPYFVL